METQEQRERIAQKIAAAKWPEGIPEPETKPKLKLSGRDGNAFSILGRAHQAAERKWTTEQWDAFHELAGAGDYDHLLQTTMRYFDVS